MSSSTDAAPVRVRDVTALLERHYPPATAESWDAVGLVCGEPDAPARRLLFTVDVTPEIVQQARDRAVDLVVAHHPLLLRGIHAIDVGHPKGRMLTDLIRAGIALYCAHTNADIGPHGTVEALASALGLTQCRPLRTTRPTLRDKLVTFIPGDHLDAVVDALAAAGAGRIGAYDRCCFTTPGTGSFRAEDAASPYVGARGETTTVPEERLEMVLPRERRAAVLAALREAHPYEEPAYDVYELAPAPGTVGLGRVGVLPEPVTVAAFAARVAEVIPDTATGVRVGGDPDRTVRTVAVQAGAGDDLLDAARDAGADLYLTSDLRHHPASEALAWAEGPALIDVAHWAAEWTWLPVVRDLVTAELEVDTELSEIRTDPWSLVVHPQAGSTAL